MKTLLLAGVVALETLGALAGGVPAGMDALSDFSQCPGKLKPELHSSSWVVRASPRTMDGDDEALKPLHLTAFRTHDAPLVSTGQRIVDTHFVFPLMNLDPAKEENYFFGPTDHYLELQFALGMKCWYRLGTSIEHTGDWGCNTLNPPDHAKYAEVLAGIVRHYTKGWAKGYEWGDRMRYWELFNEPDIAACWRGTKPQFIDLFVTCLKRLKSEFPELKIGGPAFGWANVGYLRDLLKACKAAGVKPDFISWHSYGQQPVHVLDQPAQMRKVCVAEGFGDCELVMNEWHYLPNGKWTGIQGGTYQEKLAQRTGPNGISGVNSAAFTVQVETGFHDTPLSQSYFYGSGYSGSWGYADTYGRFNKCYYAMRALGELMIDCEDRSANADRRLDSTVRSFGAWKKDRSGARLVVSDCGGKKGADAKTLKIAVRGLDGCRVASVRIIDDTRDYVAAEDAAKFADGVLTIAKADGHGIVAVVDFEKGEAPSAAALPPISRD